jgi:hypothetical protein
MSVTVTYKNVKKTTNFNVTITKPEVIRAFMLPGASEMIAGAGKTVKLRAAIVDSTGVQRNISNQLAWTVSGGGTIEVNQSGNYAAFTSDGRVGIFGLAAEGFLDGIPVSMQGTVNALLTSPKYVTNLAVLPDTISSGARAQVAWTNLNTSNVKGYEVKIVNPVDGVFRTLTLPAGSEVANFENVFAGGWYAKVKPILSSGSTGEVTSNINEKAHFYIKLRTSNLIFKDLATASPEISSAVYWLSLHQIANGFPDGTYRQANPVTRGQMAAFFHRLAGNPKPEGSPIAFRDISTYSLVDDIKWLSTAGITQGYKCTAKGKPIKQCAKKGDLLYRPTGTVSRQQMSLFLYRYAKSPAMSEAEVKSYLSKLKDTSKLTDKEAKKAIAWLVKRNITTGYPDGTFKPNSKVSRGAMSLFLMRLAQKLEVDY